MKDSYILIAGGAGFIGSNLCKYLISKNQNVLVVDDLSTGRQVNIRPFIGTKHFEFIYSSINEDRTMTILDNYKIKFIFNLACPASPPKYQADPITTLLTSVVGTKNLCELALRKNCPILHASTSEVYGDPLVHPQPESYRGNVNTIGIRSCYDEGKRASETLLSDYRRVHGLDTRIVRIFNTYGPNMDPEDGRVVSNFIMQALKGQDITIYGDGSQTRSFQYIDDLVSALIDMMLSDFSGPVNLGNPNEFTVKELADLVLKLTGSNSKIITEPLPEDDPKVRKPVIDLAKMKLGWEPKIQLEEGLIKTIDYFQSLINEQDS